MRSICIGASAFTITTRWQLRYRRTLATRHLGALALNVRSATTGRASAHGLPSKSCSSRLRCGPDPRMDALRRLECLYRHNLGLWIGTPIWERPDGVAVYDPPTDNLANSRKRRTNPSAVFGGA